MDDLRGLLDLTSGLAADFYESLPERPVFPRVSASDLREVFALPLPEGPTDPRVVVEELAAAADPGLVAMPDGRYFGFVIGGAVPASLAADWLTSAWDQNAGLYVCGPAAAIVEEVAGVWLLELLGLPSDASFGFVTGGQMANFTALAAARHHVLSMAGWDVERNGLNGAPPIRVIVGEKRHGTIDRSLRMVYLNETRGPGCAVHSLGHSFEWMATHGAVPYLTDRANYTVPVALNAFIDSTGVSSYGPMFAMAVISLIPLFVVFLVAQKQLVEGIATTGLK